MLASNGAFSAASRPRPPRPRRRRRRRRRTGVIVLGVDDAPLELAAASDDWRRGPRSSPIITASCAAPVILCERASAAVDGR